LEESSAEILIRDYFIRWYVSTLSNKIRTFSSNGITSIIPKFDDFNKLFVFLHLEPIYKNKVWVILDAGAEEETIINQLKGLYKKSGWKDSNFGQFTNHDFEKYYPSIFNEKVEATLKIADKKTKRNAKKALLDEVIEWIKQDEKTAKDLFKESAKEVIEKLKSINQELNT
jgi:polyribonucleotide nucleotidyltransferase